MMILYLLLGAVILAASLVAAEAIVLRMTRPRIQSVMKLRQAVDRFGEAGPRPARVADLFRLPDALAREIRFGWHHWFTGTEKDLSFVSGPGPPADPGPGISLRVPAPTDTVDIDQDDPPPAAGHPSARHPSEPSGPSGPSDPSDPTCSLPPAGSPGATVSREDFIEPAGPEDRRVPAGDGLAIGRRGFLGPRVSVDQFLVYFDLFHPRIARFIYRRTLDPAVAEELTERTFQRALDELWKFRWLRITFGAWLYRLAGEEIRSYEVREMGPGPWSLEVRQGLLAPRVRQLVRAGLDRRQRRFFECLVMLQDRCRELLILYYWEDMSTRQIAAILGLSDRAVGEVLIRCRRELRRLCRTKGPEPPDMVA